ncbi:hypothetical protein ACP70R_033429 [Stipagrostis hirtigluma subsp. patula]
MPTPPVQQRWAILAGIPNLVEDKEAKRLFPPGTDISVALAAPPHASVLTVPLGVSSPPTYHSYPYVAAADSSGLLLLCATHPLSAFSCMVAYNICDARSGEIVPLCRHRRPMEFLGDNVGLIMRGQTCLVAELQPGNDGSGRATLLCYTVGECRWVERELAYSPPLHGRYWFGEGVVSHGGMLWWVDLSYGLLACDPFADELELIYVPFPLVCDELPARPVDRGAHRCVKVSAGRLMYVQIHGNPDAPVVSTWALTDPALAGEWNPERRVPLADVWADESYLDTMLSWKIPALALLHPTDPDRVYFFLGSCIFAVDLRLMRVVEFSEFRMPDPPRHVMASSHFVHAWQYNPSSVEYDFVPTLLRKEKETASRSR